MVCYLSCNYKRRRSSYTTGQRTTLPELENLLKQSNANAIVYSGKFHDAIKEMSSRLSNIKYFINMNTNEHEDDKFLSFWVLLEKGKNFWNQEKGLS